MNTVQPYLTDLSAQDYTIEKPQKQQNGLQFDLSKRNSRNRRKAVGQLKSSICDMNDLGSLTFPSTNLAQFIRKDKENQFEQPQEISFNKAYKLKLKKKKNTTQIKLAQNEVNPNPSSQQIFLPLSQNNLFCRKSSATSMTRGSTGSDSFQDTQKTKSKSFFNQFFSDYIMPQDITQPLKISDFELGECIGSGKFGDVHICRHKRTNFIFALKKILKHTIVQNKMLDQFICEIKIQYSLDHENIVKLYGHFDDEYHIFLLMEYAPGGNLMSHIENSQSYTAEVLAQMLQAVSYIHQKNVIHRDIKPQNIVVYFNSTFKICDFGLSAYLRNRHDARATFCGTLDYIAPEMKNKGLYNNSVDIWGLGILCYQVIFGKAPFKDQISNWKKKSSHIQSDWNWNIQFPSYTSMPALSFISSLLKENPNERISLLSALKSQFIVKRKGVQKVLSGREEAFIRQSHWIEVK